MCGFGDKVRLLLAQVLTIFLMVLVQDRRPITPPPCVRLVIIDSETGKEVDYKYVAACTETQERKLCTNFIIAVPLTMPCSCCRSICGIRTVSKK